MFVLLLENISAGVHCITTIHLDDAGKIPDRLRNMGQSVYENDVYSFIDIGIQLQSVVKQGEKISRKITQIICLSRYEDRNEKTMIYEDGRILCRKLPPELMRKFRMAGITDPFKKSEN